MRSMIHCFLLSLLLLNCTPVTAKYYTQNPSSSRENNAAMLLKRWGTPDEKITLANGHMLYIYRVQRWRTYRGPASPVGVNVANGRPVIIDMTNVNNNLHQEPMPCTITIELDRSGHLLSKHAEGAGC